MQMRQVGKWEAFSGRITEVGGRREGDDALSSCRQH